MRTAKLTSSLVNICQRYFCLLSWFFSSWLAPSRSGKQQTHGSDCFCSIFLMTFQNACAVLRFWTAMPYTNLSLPPIPLIKLRCYFQPKACAHLGLHMPRNLLLSRKDRQMTHLSSLQGVCRYPPFPLGWKGSIYTRCILLNMQCGDQLLESENYQLSTQFTTKECWNRPLGTAQPLGNWFPEGLPRQSFHRQGNYMFKSACLLIFGVYIHIHSFKSI